MCKNQKKSSSRVIYLVALENVLDNAIISNQVKKLLLRVRKRGGENLSITLVCLLPWIELTRRGIYSYFRRNRERLAGFERELGEGGIESTLVRTPLPSAFFQMGPVRLAWFTLTCLPAVWWQIFTRRAGLVHSRYYYAAFVALLAAKLSFRKVRVIFDVRTLLPEQGVLNRAWSADGFKFRFWKAAERWMFSQAERVVSVSPAMTNRIRKTCPESRVEMVPNFVDLELFHPDPGLRETRRRELGIEGRKVLVFSGTIGGRYPADRISAAVGTFSKTFGPESFFLLLSSSDGKRLAPLVGSLEDSGLKRTVDWNVFNVLPAEIPALLNAADWALLVLADFLTSETFLPLKFAEYLALGLPILVHPANRELARLVESYGVGLPLDEGADPEVLARSFEDSYRIMRARCLETAKAEFDIDRFAAHYAKIYT